MTDECSYEEQQMEKETTMREYHILKLASKFLNTSQGPTYYNVPLWGPSGKALKKTSFFIISRSFIPRNFLK